MSSSTICAGIGRFAARDAETLDHALEAANGTKAERKI